MPTGGDGARAGCDPSACSESQASSRLAQACGDLRAVEQERGSEMRSINAVSSSIACSRSARSPSSTRQRTRSSAASEIQQLARLPLRRAARRVAHVRPIVLRAHASTTARARSGSRATSRPARRPGRARSRRRRRGSGRRRRRAKCRAAIAELAGRRTRPSPAASARGSGRAASASRRARRRDALGVQAPREHREIDPRRRSRATDRIPRTRLHPVPASADGRSEVANWLRSSVFGGAPCSERAAPVGVERSAAYHVLERRDPERGKSRGARAIRAGRARARRRTASSRRGDHERAAERAVDLDVREHLDLRGDQRAQPLAGRRTRRRSTARTRRRASSREWTSAKNSRV